MFSKKRLCKIDGKKAVSEQDWNFIKEETPAQVFSVDLYEIFKNTFL